MKNFNLKKLLSILICLIFIFATAFTVNSAKVEDKNSIVSELSGIGSMVAVIEPTEYACTLDGSVLTCSRKDGAIAYRMGRAINEDASISYYELMPNTQYRVQFDFMVNELNKYDDNAMYIAFARTSAKEETPTNAKSLVANKTISRDVGSYYDDCLNHTFIKIENVSEASIWKTAVLTFTTFDDSNNFVSQKKAENILTLVILATGTSNNSYATVAFKNFKITVSPEAADNGNVNGDSEVDILDLIALKKWLNDSKSVVSFKAENAIITDDAIIDEEDQVKLRSNLLYKQSEN